MLRRTFFTSPAHQLLGNRYPATSLSRSGVLAVLVWLTILLGCEDMQPVSLTMEDFRFVPDFVQVKTSSPLALSLYNAGREVHEFDSPILLYSGRTPAAHAKSETAGSAGILLQPGQSLQLVAAPPAGTYLYVCRRKGHANMTGTLIVQ